MSGIIGMQTFEQVQIAEHMHALVRFFQSHAGNEMRE